MSTLIDPDPGVEADLPDSGRSLITKIKLITPKGKVYSPEETDRIDVIHLK